MAKKMKPVHPGEILREEFMKPLGLSMNKLSLDLRVPLTRIDDIVNGRRRVTADTALRLARYFIAVRSEERLRLIRRSR